MGCLSYLERATFKPLPQLIVDEPNKNSFNDNVQVILEPCAERMFLHKVQLSINITQKFKCLPVKIVSAIKKLFVYYFEFLCHSLFDKFLYGFWSKL